jgi:hypothetical protein
VLNVPNTPVPSAGKKGVLGSGGKRALGRKTAWLRELVFKSIRRAPADELAETLSGHLNGKVVRKGVYREREGKTRRGAAAI